MCSTERVCLSDSECRAKVWVNDAELVTKMGVFGVLKRGWMINCILQKSAWVGLEYEFLRDFSTFFFNLRIH